MAYETICIEMPCEQAAELYRFCSEHRMTLDELVDQFLRWCIREPEAFMEWYEKCEKEEPSVMNRTPGMPEITQDELIAHIEDENFLRVYGNPVWIRSRDGAHDCVLMYLDWGAAGRDVSAVGIRIADEDELYLQEYIQTGITELKRIAEKCDL